MYKYTPISIIFIVNLPGSFSFLRGDGLRVWYVQVNVRDRLPKLLHVITILNLIYIHIYLNNCHKHWQHACKMVKLTYVADNDNIPTKTCTFPAPAHLQSPFFLVLLLLSPPVANNTTWHTTTLMRRILPDTPSQTLCDSITQSLDRIEALIKDRFNALDGVRSTTEGIECHCPPCLSGMTHTELLQQSYGEEDLFHEELFRDSEPDATDPKMQKRLHKSGVCCIIPPPKNPN